MIPRLAAFLVRRRGWLLFLAVVLCAAAWWPAQRISFDRSIENMFPADDPMLVSYLRLKRTFGNDEIALVAYVDPDALSNAGLERLGQLTDRLSHVEGVESVFSLASLPSLARIALRTSMGSNLRGLAEGFILGEDGETVGIVCILTPESKAKVPRTRTVDQMRQLVTAHDPSGVVTGEPVMIVDGFRYLEADGQLLGTLATLLLMLVIGFSFRSIRWMLIPLAATCATLWWTQTLLVGAGLRLSMVSSMLWAIVTVVVVATVVHIVVAFRTHRAMGLVSTLAMRRTLILLLAPITWACLTDAVGFGSLLVARVGPVHDFGLMMVLGALVALVAIAMLVPGLALLGRLDADPRRAWGERHLDLGLARLAELIQRFPRAVGIAALVPALVASVGLVWLEVETDFTRNFRQTSPVVHAYRFVETRLGGAGVWDVLIPVPDNPPADLLARVAHLEDRLRSEVMIDDGAGGQQPGLTKVLSLASASNVVVRTESFDFSQIEQLLRLLRQTLPVVDLLYATDPEDGNRGWLRIMLRAREQQPSHVKEKIIADVRRICSEEFPDAEVTGIFVLLARLIESISRDQWTTFALATVGIGLMMRVALGSWRLALVALIPNALPILLVTGLMGWGGWRINMGAAMIASVSMGLAVDSSIHYITAYNRQRKADVAVDEAIRQIHHSVGRAIIFSTLALVAGFSSLAASQFVPTMYFGVLVSLALVGGLLGNLVLLPVLLKLVDRGDAGVSAGQASA